MGDPSISRRSAHKKLSEYLIKSLWIPSFLITLPNVPNFRLHVTWPDLFFSFTIFFYFSSIYLPRCVLSFSVFLPVFLVPPSCVISSPTLLLFLLLRLAPLPSNERFPFGKGVFLLYQEYLKENKPGLEFYDSLAMGSNPHMFRGLFTVVLLRFREPISKLCDEKIIQKSTLRHSLDLRV